MPVFYYANPESKALNIDDKQCPIVRFVNTSDPKEKPAGVALFKSTGSAETLLEGVIAVIKRIHHEINSCVVDVWVTSIARAAIADRPPTAEFEVEMRVDHLLWRKVGDRIQTLSSVTLSAPQIGTIPVFQIAFSYGRSDAH